MSKYCRNCGQQMNDGAAFCPNCGMRSSLQPGAQNSYTPPAGAGFNPKPAAGKKLLGLKLLLPVVAIVIVAVVAVNAFSGGSGPDGALKKVVRALEKGDIETLGEMLPEAILDYNMTSRSTVEGYYEEIVELAREECGRHYSIDYEITEKKDFINSTIDDRDFIMAKKLKNRYQIKEGWLYEMNVTFKGSYGSTDDEIGALVLKEDGKWKVLFGL